MKRSWSYLATPLHLYLSVMLPICVLMGWVAAGPQRWGIRATAGAVIVFSLYGVMRGYARGLSADARGVRFRTPWRVIDIAWKDVRRVDAYIPSGGINGIRYVYVTTRDEPPAGKWHIDGTTVQLQDRPGLLEALRTLRDGRA